jgi:hypothetical protein
VAEPNPETPPKVVLFSGHMIDAPGREKPRFPPDKEPLAASAIAGALSELDVGGSRPLHLRRRLRWRSAVRRVGAHARRSARTLSVDFAGDGWRARFFAAKARATLHVLPREKGPTPQGEDAYERNNLWMLDAASRFGPNKVEFVCLWNGEGGDGPGGTRHMREEVEKKGGRAHWLDTTRLWI